MKTSLLYAAFALVLAGPSDAFAVSVSPDGIGQALIYPYYTVQSSNGNAFNTYLSVANHAADAKALRVRFREGRLSKETLSFNLFLGAGDTWTGAVVPAADSARLVTRDSSCTDPAFQVDFGTVEPAFAGFRSETFTGTQDDDANSEPGRVREGFVEVLEMGSLAGASAAAATRSAAGARNCQLLRGSGINIAAPTGGISGTLTLINVASGMDFTVNAEALANLGTRAFYRAAGDPYPDFAAAEIDPVSLVISNGKAYRSTWSRPIDAVSAALMRSRWMGEYILDINTDSRTDVVVTFPTRHFHSFPTGGSAPFPAPNFWAPVCVGPQGRHFGERLDFQYFGRNGGGGGSGSSTECGFICPPNNGPAYATCASSAVGSLNRSSTPMVGQPSSVLGSLTKGLGNEGIPILSTTPNGWIGFLTLNTAPMVSLASSIQVDLATGAQTGGAHVIRGLPVVGMMVRTFQNGTLTCGASNCQGNYGGGFALKYERSISP